MKTCLVAATPYHFYSLLQLLLKIPELAKGYCDLFVRPWNGNWSQVANNFKQMFSLDNCVVAREWQPAGSGFKRNIECAIGALFPKAYLGAITTTEFGYSPIFDTYERVISGWYNSITISLMLSNPQADRILFEDGLGSYRTESFEEILAPRKKLFKRLGREFPNLKPSTLYLNSPQYSRTTFTNNVRTLKCDDATLFLDSCARVFSFCPDYRYVQNKVVYLTQPDTSDADREVRNSIEERLASCGHSIVARIHPRDDVLPSGINWEIDTGTNLWELLCANYITDEHVLVGGYSTGLFSPKLQFDREPWVLFTMKLYESIPHKKMEELVKLASWLKSIYRNPNKIVLVESLDALTRHLGAIGVNGG